MSCRQKFFEGEEGNYASIGKKWLHGIIHSYIVITVAQHSLKVKLTSGLVIHCQFDQLIKDQLIKF